MQSFRRTQSLDRCDLVSIVHDSKVETRELAPAVHVHRACTALSVIAALLCAGQCQRLAEAIEQCCPRIDPDRMVRTVYAKGDRNGTVNSRHRRAPCYGLRRCLICGWTSRHQARSHSAAAGQPELS